MKKKLVLFSFLLVLSFFLFGCDEGETTLVTQPEGDDVATAGNDEETTEQDVDDSSSAFDQFKNFVLGSPEYRVVYDYEISGMEMVMTQYIKGSRVRTDSSYAGVNSRNYIFEDRFVSCSEIQGAWNCFEVSMDEVDDLQAGSDPISEEFESGDFSGNIEPLPDRVIAGVNAKCFSVTSHLTIVGEDTEHVYTYCYSAQGIPLLMEDNTGSWRLIATEFSTSVPDSVFELPAEPGSFDDMIGAWGY